MDETLSVYLPMDRRHALATGIPLPERTWGAALFADISGFTPLTEALARELGPRRGAEELPRQLNLVYDALIREVDRYGGSVIDFAGDAITCWFDQDPGIRAIACALAMQGAMSAFATLSLPSGNTVSLALKVAVASGPVRRFLVGDPAFQRIDTLAGATLSRMAAAERVAEKGEVVLDEATAQRLEEVLTIQEWRSAEPGTRFAVVASLREVVEPQPWEALDVGSLGSDELRPWLLPLVYERLRAGLGEFLTELRPAVALFLRFGDIDYDGDPEAGQKLDSFVRWVQTVISQYEGTLLSVTIGDKGSYLYLAFGAPIAHEDDARRAALSALALRQPPEALAFIRAIQIGISRGTMRTGAYGGRTRRTYGVLGDEVNLAARLMQHAQPGQIIAGGRVQGATESLFAWQWLDEIRVKGKRDLIPIFALLGPATSSRPAPEPIYALPMIGRATELALLAEKLTLAQLGQGQVIGIMGEAGMGKSRLVAEAIRLAQERSFISYGGECHSYGTTTPYLVWQPIWRAFFGLEATAPLDQQSAQLARAITDLDPMLLDRLPLLAPVLGLPLAENNLTRPLGPELRKASREALLIDLLKARARRLRHDEGALLLVLEDCHWLDAASHDFLEIVGRTIWNLPVLIVLAYRPPELERLVSPRVTALDHFTPLALTELSETEAEHLVTNRLTHLHPLDERRPPPALITHLVARAEGNPFYLEELLNYLHDQGLDPYEPQALAGLDLPTSLHSLILSRIDQLSERQKATLKVASVIGRSFRFGWLCGYYPALGSPAEVQADLEQLRRLDLTPLETPEPEPVYLFKHIITQEVAYESLSYATRATLHEQLGHYLETQVEERHLDLLAYHYGRSENKAKKQSYLWQAARAATMTYANSAALEYYQQLLPLLAETEGRATARLEWGRVLERVGAWDNAEEQYRHALTHSIVLRDASGQAQCCRTLGKLEILRGNDQEAHRWLKQAHAGWVQLGDERAQGQTLAELGQLFYQQGHYQAAIATLTEGLQRATAQADGQTMALALETLGLVAYRQGDYAASQERQEQALALRRREGNKGEIARSLQNLANLAYSQGDYRHATTRYEESLLLFREVGNKRLIAVALNNLGVILAEQGEYEGARARHEESLALRLELGDRRGLASSLNNLGFIAYHQKNYAAARDFQARSLALAREMDHKSAIAFSLISLGTALLALREAAEALPLCTEALLLVGELNDKQQMAYALVGIAGATIAGATARVDSAEVVTHLLAAAMSTLENAGIVMEREVRPLYEETRATARMMLGERAFARAWAVGQGMRLDEAVALALAL